MPIKRTFYYFLHNPQSKRTTHKRTPPAGQTKKDAMIVTNSHSRCFTLPALSTKHPSDSVQCCDNTAQVGCTAPVFTNRVDGARSMRRIGVTTVHDRGNREGQTHFVPRMLQKHSQSLLTRTSHTEPRTDCTGHINIHTCN